MAIGSLPDSTERTRMARLSMNEMTTYRWSFEEDVAHYAAAGIPAVGVWRQKLSDYGEEKGIELLVESGLAVSSLLWAGGFTGSDGRTFRESLDDAAEAVRLAAQMHAGCVVVYSGSRAGHTHNHAKRLVRDALRELCARPPASSVILAIEPMHAGCAAEWTFLTDINATLELIEAVGHPAAAAGLRHLSFRLRRRRAGSHRSAWRRTSPSCIWATAASRRSASKIGPAWAKAISGWPRSSRGWPAAATTATTRSS